MSAAAFVALVFGVEGTDTLSLSEPTGADERAARGSAQALLERVIPGPIRVDDLTVGDRDRALAALYRMLYGDDVRADARCVACGSRFEMRFRLGDLVADRRPDGRARDGVLTMGESILRVPRVRDLGVTAPESLVERLVTAGPLPEIEAASEAIDAADPALELDLTGNCPECGEVQSCGFSMTRFFSAALHQDLAALMSEVHLLATRYGWAFDAILSLTRSERRALHRLVVADLEGTPVRLGQVA
jgi:hypothetical protein